ncbi:hypothetical protein K9N68_36475 (plasmid) [Kovacikia minuta CCNUW1]|uniref:hypothetical protein n=1 Tax=Kovacikia minuta TaxID=2931930 RepID=UPI001CCAE900|nr:hypothetical protein [Kovacikia minuta]UBF30739.1 hypothetical protein K9N68_36475 [Kovacikia minuta CCNUW1]
MSTDLALGEYFHPEGYLEYVNTLPFLGRLNCAIQAIVAGSGLLRNDGGKATQCQKFMH